MAARRPLYGFSRNPFVQDRSDDDDDEDDDEDEDKQQDGGDDMKHETSIRSRRAAGNVAAPPRNQGAGRLRLIDSEAKAKIAKATRIALALFGKKVQLIANSANIANMSMYNAVLSMLDAKHASVLNKVITDIGPGAKDLLERNEALSLLQIAVHRGDFVMHQQGTWWNHSRKEHKLAYLNTINELKALL